MNKLHDDVWINFGQTNHWFSRDGKKHFWADIDCVWLSNIIRMLERKYAASIANENAAWSYGGNSDSMGSYYAEQAADSLNRENTVLSERIDFYKAYLAWRESNCYIQFAPRKEKKARTK